MSFKFVSFLLSLRDVEIRLQCFQWNHFSLVWFLLLLYCVSLVANFNVFLMFALLIIVLRMWARGHTQTHIYICVYQRCIAICNDMWQMNEITHILLWHSKPHVSSDALNHNDITISCVRGLTFTIAVIDFLLGLKPFHREVFICHVHYTMYSEKWIHFVRTRFAHVLLFSSGKLILVTLLSDHYYLYHSCLFVYLFVFFTRFCETSARAILRC